MSPWPNAYTVASGLNDAYPDACFTALNALRESRGTAVSVTDEEIIKSQLILAKEEGIFAEPAGAASLAGAAKIAQAGSIDKDEKVACMITGSGLKQPELLTEVLNVLAMISFK